MSKTTVIKTADISRKWYLVDASDDTLGRVSTRIANLLIGKQKVDYTPHIDNGDFVVVINAKDLKVTGDKMNAKKYYRHSSYPGGLKQKTLAEAMEKDPTFVIRESVKGMLPKNKLQDGRISRLKVYADEKHEQQAQKPEKVSI